MTTVGSRGVLRGLRTLFGPGAVGGLGDAQLIERFARKRVPAGAFEAIVARHGPMVLGVCRRVLRDDHGADDAFESTFLVLARKAGGLARPERLACWLHGVARRVALKARAVAARRHAREGPLGDVDAPAPESLDDASDLRALLDAELVRLPARQRAAIVLHDLEGRSVAETAAALGVAEGTVWSRLHRGRDRLRSRLARRGLALAAAPAALFPARDAAAAVPPARLIEPTVLAATGRAAAGVVPARASALALGVLTTMTMTRLSTAGLAGLALLGTGLALDRAQAKPRHPAALAARGDDTKDDKDKAAKTDAKKLQGAWKAIAVTEKGRVNPNPEKYLMTFKDDTFAVTMEGKEAAKGTFKLDPSMDPRTIDCEVTEAEKDDFKGKTAQGIYAFDGEKLKWCSTPPGHADRPNDFTADDDTERLLVVFEREEN